MIFDCSKSFLLFNSWHPNLVCSKSGIRRPTLSTRHRHPAYQKGETRKTMSTWISKCPTSCSFHTQHADITTALCWIMLAGKLSTPDGSNFNLPTCIRSNMTCCIEASTYLTKRSTTVGSKNSSQLNLYQPSSDQYKFNFFPRTTIIHWNSLPASLAEAPSLTQFN